MSLKFIPDYTEGTGNLPWIKEFLLSNSVIEGSTYTLNSLELVKSNKGYLGITDAFQIFLWKNSVTTKFLTEALEAYSQQQDGYKILVVVKKESQNGFQLAVDPEQRISWFKVGKKYTLTESFVDSDTEELNPFLIPVPSILVSPAQRTSRQSKSGATTKRPPKSSSPPH